MNNGKQLSLNFIIQMLTFVVNLCISFFLTPYVINYIGKEVYGFVSLATQFTSYASMFTVALNGMLSRYVTIAVSKKDYNSASVYMSSVLIANIVVMLALLPISILFIFNLHRFINLPIGFEWDIKILFAFTFLGFLINLPGCVCNSATYACNRLDKSNGCNLICSLIRIITLFGLLICFTPHVWYVGLSSALYTVVMIITNIRFKKTLLPQVRISFVLFNFSKVKELLIVGVWNTINQLSQILLTGLDLVIANVFVSVSAMNMLSYGKMLPGQLLSLITMTSGIFGPMLTLSYGKGDKEDFLRKIKFSLRLCGFLCSVPVIGIMIFGEDFYRLWLNALTIEEIKLVAILSIITIIPQFFSVYIYPLYTINSITTKLKFPVLVTLLMGVLNVVMVFGLVRYTNIGVYAVAGVSSILSLGNILVFIPLYVAHTLKLPKWTFYSPISKGIINNICLLIIFSFIRKIFVINNWGNFFGCIVVTGIIGYLIGFICLFDKNEKLMIFKFIQNKIGR